MKVNARIFELQLTEAMSKQRGYDKLEEAFVKSQQSIAESQKAIDKAINEIETASVEKLDEIETTIAQKNTEKLENAKNAENTLANRQSVNTMLKDKDFMADVKKETKLMKQEMKMEKILGDKFESGLSYASLTAIAAANKDMSIEAASNLDKQTLVNEGKKNLGPLAKLRNVAKNVEAKISASIQRTRANKAALAEVVAEMKKEKEEKRINKDVAVYANKRVRLDDFQMRLETEKAFVPYASEMAEVIKHAADLASRNRAGFEELNAEALHAEISSLTKERSAILEAQDAATRAIAKQVDNMNLLYATKNEAIAVYREEVNKARENAINGKIKELGLNRDEIIKIYPELTPMSMHKAQADVMKTPQFENFFEEVVECEKAINAANIELNQFKSRNIELKAQLSEIVAAQHDVITKKDMEKINDGRAGITQIFRQNHLAECGVRADLLVGMPADKAKAAQLAIDMGVPVDFINAHIKDMTPEALHGVAFAAIEVNANENKAALSRIAKALDTSELSIKSMSKDFSSARKTEAAAVNEAAKQAETYKNELASKTAEFIADNNEQARNKGIVNRLRTSIEEKVENINKTIKAAFVGYKDTETKLEAKENKPKSQDFER